MDIFFPSRDGRSSLTIHVDYRDGSEIDASFAIVHGDVSAHSEEWLVFFTEDVRRFVADLTAFSQAHEGRPSLESFNAPGTLLCVFATDRAQHAAVMVMLQHPVSADSGMDDSALEVSFELDPSRWDDLLAAWQHVLDDVTGKVEPRPSF